MVLKGNDSGGSGIKVVVVVVVAVELML
ncbi:hypothetical protein E2C01_082025 [Portunus trituberculatus]|uniref:Uncharacterized protein n=1 Tax=Portunus trituberculatus TaxID=210409 RepID=A0A5B7IY54_PORTR|nr:hypothetical protein [Portunus trituberculatus]